MTAGAKMWDGADWASGPVRIRAPGSRPSLAWGVNTFPRVVEFAGYDWFVKRAVPPGMWGPGPNYFSDSQDAVSVDTQGRLHLKVYQSPRGWECAELVSRLTFGYGRYEWWLDSTVDDLDDNIVLGLFTWDDASPNVEQDWVWREIDIEFARWGIDADNLRDTNTHWSVQPNWLGVPFAGSNTRVFETEPSLPIRHWFEWRQGPPRSVRFGAPTAIPARWAADSEYVFPDGGNTPNAGPEGPQVRMNLWLCNPGHATGPSPGPRNGQPREFIIRDFKYTPASGRFPFQAWAGAERWAPVRAWTGSDWRTL